MRLVLLFYIIKYSKDHIKCLKIKSKRKKQVLSYVLGWDVLVFSFLNFRGIFFCFNYFQITFFLCACAYQLFAYFFLLCRLVF